MQSKQNLNNLVNQARRNSPRSLAGPRPRIDPYRWRCEYLDGTAMDEPLEGGTIRERRPGRIVRLILIGPNDEELMWIGIEEGYKPLFYRKRSVGINPSNGATGQVRLDATVFGTGRAVVNSDAKANDIDGHLFAVVGNKVVDCPPDVIDTAAIEQQLEVK